MEPVIGLFDVDLVAENPFIGTCPMDVVDKVEEMHPKMTSDVLFL